MSKPLAGTYPVYFERYILLVDAASLGEAREKYSSGLVSYFEQLSPAKADYRYAPDKWSLKEMLQHIIDTERIFAYRLLCLSRNETTALPGFDENQYAANSHASRRSWSSLLEELKAVRLSTDLLINSLDEEQLLGSGITNGSANTALAIGFMVYGHILHHIAVIEHRYLNE